MRRIRFKKFCLIIISAIITCSCARSTVLLRGDEAQKYLARNDHLIAPGYYTFGAVRNRQVGVIMVAVFNRDRGEKNDGNFQFLKREKSMGYHSSSKSFNVILLNSPAGERGIEPTNETLGEIRKNNLSPAIILNSEGEEEAVIYQPAGQMLAAFVRPNGEVRLEFGRRIQSEGDIIYSFHIGQAFKSSKKSLRRGRERRRKKR